MRLLPDEASTEIVAKEAAKTDLVVVEPVKKLTCKERAKEPCDKCYFRSEAYFTKTKE